MSIHLGIDESKIKKCLLLVCGACLLLFSVTSEATNRSKAIKNKNIGSKTTKKNVKKSVRKFSSLKISSTKYKSGNLEIKGKTDLPDNSILLINIMPEDANDSELKLSSKTIVKSGKFCSTIKVPDNPELYKGPYRVEVKFLLEMQTNLKVLHLIGDSAKNLIGNLVVLVPFSNYKSLQYSATKEIWPLELKAYSAVKPKNSMPGEPKYILACFFREWKQKNWEGMLKYSYKPWAQGEKNPGILLKSWFGSKNLIGAKILNTSTKNPLMTEINFKAYYIDDEGRNRDIKTETGTVKIIKDDNGNWGVFPLSVIKKDAIYKMDLKI
jgi:hypothetical protein